MILTYEDIASLISDTAMFRFDVLVLYQRGATLEEFRAAERCYHYHREFSSFVESLGARKYPVEALLRMFTRSHNRIPRRVL